MPYCSILQCKNDSRRKNINNGAVSYHRFPNDPYIKEKWIDATGRKNWFPTKNSTICSSHFSAGDFDTTKRIRIIFPSAFPHINVWEKKKSDDDVTILKDDSTTSNTCKTNFMVTVKENIFIETPRIKKLRTQLGHVRQVLKKQKLKIKRLQELNRRQRLKILDLQAKLNTNNKNEDGAQIFGSMDVTIRE